MKLRKRFAVSQLSESSRISIRFPRMQTYRHSCLLDVILLLSSPDKETIQFISFAAYTCLRLAICAQFMHIIIVQRAQSVYVLFAGAQKFKTFHFRIVLLSADDTYYVLWIKWKRNFALKSCAVISLKFSATEKRLGKTSFIINIKTCRINITR